MQPCCRAGLYKQLAELKNLLAEFREAPARNTALRMPIIQTLNASGHLSSLLVHACRLTGPARCESAPKPSCAHHTNLHCATDHPKDCTIPVCGVSLDASSSAWSCTPDAMLCLDCLMLAGLQNDCPFRPGANGQSHLSADDAEQVAAADFEEYASRLNAYLQVGTSLTSC